MEIRIGSRDELPQLARQVLAFAERQNKKVLFFYGELGAGKTTLIQHLCRVLGSQDLVSSPTFSLINEYAYRDEKGREQIICHMDLYRLKSLAEALDIGLEEYLAAGHWCFVEWPQLIEPLLSDEEVLKVSIEEEGTSVRKIVLL